VRLILSHSSSTVWFVIRKSFLVSMSSHPSMEYDNFAYEIRRTASTWVLILIIFNLFGCGTKQSPPEQSDFVEGDAVTIRDKVLNTLRASRVTAQLYSSDIGVDSGFLNNVNRTDQYLKAGDKGAVAANLGIYLSDLSFLVVFDQRDDANRYFDACLRLSEFLGMKKQFGESIHFGFNEILAGDQKLQKSFDRMFKDANNVSAGDEFKKLHSSALTGYYIEELYHLVSFLRSTKPEQGNPAQIFFTTLTTLIDQKNELNNLVSYFDHMDLKPEGISLYQDLLSLQASYLALDGPRLLSKNDPSLIVEDKTLADIFESISLIRTKITDL